MLERKILSDIIQPLVQVLVDFYEAHRTLINALK